MSVEPFAFIVGAIVLIGSIVPVAFLVGLAVTVAWGEIRSRMSPKQ